jgi:NAD(P)-dependent dehydrogenase (short-subunit alcohol dehydrogenase family)
MSDMNGKLAGRVALVTGAGRRRGIGRATALRLAQEGAAVVVAAAPRSPDTYPEDEKACGWRGAASVVDEIAAMGGRALALDCDVTDPRQVQAMIDQAEAVFGTPDAIVNNAGVAGGAGGAPLLDADEAEWRRTVDVNLTGVFHVCKAAGRAMRAAGKPGAIVNLSSLAGRVGMPNFGAYCASKFAVIGLTQQLAMEVAALGIRVNAVCPGSVETDMIDGTLARTAAHSTRVDLGGVRAAVLRTIPLRRLGSAEEPAAVIAFLLGPDASFITGQTVNIDGGVRMD